MIELTPRHRLIARWVVFSSTLVVGLAAMAVATAGLREAHLAETAGVTPAPPRTPNAAHAGAPTTA